MGLANLQGLLGLLW